MSYIQYDRLLFSYDISDTAKILYAIIKSRCDYCDTKELQTYYTIDELMQITHKSRPTIISAIKQLEQHKMLYVKRVSGCKSVYYARKLLRKGDKL